MAGVSTATGFAANVLSNVLSRLWNKVVEEVKMVVFLPRAVTQMKKEVQTLDDAIQDINAELDQEQRRPKRIVKAWLDTADELKKSSESIGNKYENYQQHKSCLGCCPRCLCRYSIGKSIRDWKRDVSELRSQKAQPEFPRVGEYGDPTPRPQVLIQNPESGFVADSKRSAQMKRVERWLADKDSNIRFVGLHGMGGVGKTLLLDTINDSLKVKESFDFIIKVTVSRNNILDLQYSVAKRLKLKDFPESLEERKEILRSYLKGKSFLLLLDDMWADDMWTWTSGELQNLGVSVNDTGFKIALTTRDIEVCARMNVQETIKLEPLLEDKGWQLFSSRAFQNRNGNVPHEIEEVARQIAKECKGLPLAIIVVAAAMTHHTDLKDWEVALDQMRNVHETFYDLHAGVDKKLFQRLRWSYNVLPDYLKTCFLYFAAYPEDRVISVEEVIDIWVAEGLLKASGKSCLFDTGRTFIKHLKDRCLIEGVRRAGDGYVTMHDILHDLAIRIAEKEHSCYFKAGQGVSHFPIEEVNGKACERMSFMYNHLHSLPTTLACSSLSVLFLRGNPGIKEVPGSFLRELPSLKVLDLSFTGITSLPPSIGNLKHLVFVQLEATLICELPQTIGDLKELQFLNVSQCEQLRCLPERISELKRLRGLDIRFCKRLSHLPRGITELVSLERLYIRNSISLDFEDDTNTERKYACLKDLQSLCGLKVLWITMKSPVKEGVIGKWSKMRDLSLTFECVNQDYLPQDMQAMKDLESLILDGCSVDRLPSWVSELPKLACLRLFSCEQLKELPAMMPSLRDLIIVNCDKLEELEMGFPKLRNLSLCDLKSLECVGAVAAAASGSGGLGEGASPLPMLESLWVIDCPKLKRLRGRWDKLKCLEKVWGNSREWWDAIQWDDDNIKTSLQSKYTQANKHAQGKYVTMY